VELFSCPTAPQSTFDVPENDSNGCADATLDSVMKVTVAPNWAIVPEADISKKSIAAVALRTEALLVEEIWKS
jgi:hypothetical protein